MIDNSLVMISDGLSCWKIVIDEEWWLFWWFMVALTIIIDSDVGDDEWLINDGQW